MTKNYNLNRRILTWDSREVDFPADTAINMIQVQDTVFGFLDEESEGSSVGSLSDNGYGDNDAEEEAENEDNAQESDDNKNFWESQNQILHGTLCRTTSIESKIRAITKEAVREASICSCGRAINGDSCRNCLMKNVCGRLQNAGFNSAICKSKWRSSSDTPSGEHTFIDVIDNSSKKEMRVIVELNFRAEFEMARGISEYNQLINKLPEIFVGKIERLLSVIKILCEAAKKCMKEKKMHLAPWRKQRYMQAKWLKVRERMMITTSSSLPAYNNVPAAYSGHPVRPRASMLTVDLLENMQPALHLTAVRVV